MRALFKSSSPNRLYNHLLEHFGLSSDASLAERIQLDRFSILKARQGRISVSPFAIMSIHLSSGISVEKVMELGGITRDEDYLK